jgi:hypothetical protein
MGSSGKAKGAAFERAVMRVFNSNGYPYVERRPAGATIDKGDLVGFGSPLVIECRNRNETRLPAWAEEAERKAAEAWPDDPDALGVCIAKRWGTTDASKSTVVMTMDTFVRMLDVWLAVERP